MCEPGRIGASRPCDLARERDGRELELLLPRPALLGPEVAAIVRIRRSPGPAIHPAAALVGGVWPCGGRRQLRHLVAAPAAGALVVGRYARLFAGIPVLRVLNLVYSCTSTFES